MARTSAVSQFFFCLFKFRAEAALKLVWYRHVRVTKDEETVDFSAAQTAAPRTMLRPDGLPSSRLPLSLVAFSEPK